MIIIRNDFSEVIEITTNVTVRQLFNSEFWSSVHVLCIVRNVRNDIHDIDREATKQLKAMMGITVPQNNNNNNIIII